MAAFLEDVPLLGGIPKAVVLDLARSVAPVDVQAGKVRGPRFDPELTPVT